MQAPSSSHPALAALSTPGMLCSLRLSTCPSFRTSSAHKGCYPHGKFPVGPSLASWVTHPALSGLSQRGWPLKEHFMNHSVCYITVSGCLGVWIADMISRHLSEWETKKTLGLFSQARRSQLSESFWGKGRNFKSSCTEFKQPARKTEERNNKSATFT